ncbi:MAG: tyrosinase family protein [Nitrospiraceae bacterium]
MKRRLFPQKAIRACLLALMLLVPVAEAQAQVFVRRDFATLTTVQINALRNGIREMQRRSAINPTDPTGWLYQANIHGTTDRPLRTAWNTCQHGSYFFLSWHRMYLYYFERILRRASGNPPGFALPYWNYNSATQRALPSPFRLPANADNPLYVSGRLINNGNPLGPDVVSFESAFRLTNFSSPAGDGISFGGQMAGPLHTSDVHGEFENQPHDVVHSAVGGWMRNVILAARDPIFWLHHANIDRLWKRWLDRGGGRSNPPASDTGWMNTRFTFFTENGQPVTRTGARILNTVTQLNYRYDDDPAGAAPAAVPAPERLAAREMLGSSIETEVDLHPTRYVRFSIPIKEEVRPKITRFTAGEGVAGTLVLNIEGIEYDEDLGVYYQIYINLPTGEKAPDPRSPHFVGTLAPFALAQGGKRMLAITEAARALKGVGRWNEESISVTFVPRGPLTPPGEADTPIPEAAQVVPTQKVKIGRISISMQ